MAICFSPTINFIFRYEESVNQWVFISSMNIGRCTFSAVVSEDNAYIYVIGGFDNGPLSSVERYIYYNQNNTHNQL